MSKEKLYTPPIPMFRKLMDDTGTKREDISKALGVSTVAIGQYYNGETLPSIENLIKIADYFDVSTDYLLGRTDISYVKEDIIAAQKYTGLSNHAIEAIKSVKEYSKSLLFCLDLFLQSDHLTELLSSIDAFLYYTNVEEINECISLKEFLSENGKSFDNNDILYKGIKLLSEKEQANYNIWKLRQQNRRLAPYIKTEYFEYVLFRTQKTYTECIRELRFLSTNTVYDTSYILDKNLDIQEELVLGSPYIRELKNEVKTNGKHTGKAE